MNGGGRPLRFLALVLVGWIGMRVWQLWPAPPPVRTLRHVVRHTGKQEERQAVRPVMVRADAAALPAPARRPSPRSPDAVREALFRRLTPYVPPISSPVAPQADEVPAGSARIAGHTPAASASSRRWSASGWTMWRGSGSGGGVATPQLGGSQAGIRIARTVDARGRVAIAARVAAALDVRQREAAVGIEWRPTTLPMRIVAEQRFGLANQRGGPAVGLVGGATDVRLPAGFRLEGYAQAGAVLRRTLDGYADGAAHITRPVVGGAGSTRVSLGLGIAGGAQRGAQRLDIGPSATIDLPIGDALHLRIALEWRQRIVGRARPGSGPALSIGADY